MLVRVCGCGGGAWGSRSALAFRTLEVSALFLSRPFGAFRGLFVDFAGRSRLFPWCYLQAGDAVIWDSRLPHETEATLLGTRVREVVYTAFLPPLPENQAYAVRGAVTVL